MICTSYNPTSLFFKINSQNNSNRIYFTIENQPYILQVDMCLRMATSTIYKMLCENKCERLVFDNSSPTKWYLEIHNRKMTSTEAPMLQNNMNWEHVSLQNHSRHSVYRLHKPLLSVVFILTTIEYVYIYIHIYVQLYQVQTC